MNTSNAKNSIVGMGGGDSTAEQEEGSLGERYERAIAAIDTSPTDAVQALSAMQYEIVTQKALFSVQSETIDDISTSSIPFLLLEHYLAMAYTQLPSTPGSISTRQVNLLKACDLWTSFLSKLESLELLTKSELTEYHELLEVMDQMSSNNNNNDGSNRHEEGPTMTMMMPSAVNRDTKIARYRRKQQAENEQSRLKSLRERRSRMGIAPDDELDGHDMEALCRSIALTTLEIGKATCLDEWSSVLRELPMIAMMVKSQQQQQNGQGRYGGASDVASDSRQSNSRQMVDGGTTSRGGPLQVTHITQDGTTGQLLFRREEIRANVVRAGWNQPTMTLDELADREIADAQDRERRQRESEANAMSQPRRMEQLYKDGLEDDAQLVDASAILDRQWDDFKDANPRGSGNKRGDVGDRNF